METSIQTDCFPFNIPSLITSSSLNETVALGFRLASVLEKGSIIGIKGPLGAGKTCLVKGIAAGLGIKEVLTSPTYTIISEYEAVFSGENIPFFHIDAYRLAGDDDFADIGGEDIIFGNGISVIEWSDRLPGLIPNEALKVDIEISGENERKVHIYY